MVESNLIEELKITKEVEDEIEMQKNVYLKQYKYREEFELQLSKLSIFFMHLTACSNWNVRCDFVDDEDNDVRHYTANIYINKSYLKKYRFIYSFELEGNVKKYALLNEEYKLFYTGDDFEELFSRLCDDHLKVWTPWVLKLRKEKE